MILLFKDGKFQQYWGLDDNQVRDLLDRGYRVFRFDSSAWRHMEYTKPKGWEKVPLDAELYPKEPDARKSPR